MSIETVAILSPGDMGHAIGRLLRENELRVLTCLAGRSNRTRELSQQAGIIDVPSLGELVEQSDVLMSVTVSEAVPGLCEKIADAVKATGTDLLFAECNAIAPELSRKMETVLSEADTQSERQPRGQFPALIGAGDQHHPGAGLFAEGFKGGQVEVDLIIGQQRVGHRIDLLSAVGDGLLGGRIQGVSQQGNRQFFAQVTGNLLPGGQQFKGRAGQFAA